MARFYRTGSRTMALILGILMLLAMTACSETSDWNWPQDIDPAKIAAAIGDEDLYGYKIASAPTDSFAIVMEGGGAIIVKLDAKAAPITVDHIKTLVGAGFYNGLTFHRVVRDFVIQAGCPNGDGTGDSGKSIKGEFSANGVKNTLKHTAGADRKSVVEGNCVYLGGGRMI